MQNGYMPPEGHYNQGGYGGGDGDYGWDDYAVAMEDTTANGHGGILREAIMEGMEVMGGTVDMVVMEVVSG